MKKKIVDYYNCRIGGPKCIECEESDEKLNKFQTRTPPHAYWNLGCVFNQNTYPRIAFVGKTTWVKKENLNEEKKIGSVYKVWGADYYYDKDGKADRRYWDVIKEVATKVHKLPSNKLEFLKYIFVTNLVKCNIEDSREKSNNITQKRYFNKCVDIFEKEISITRPSHVILFTGVYYDNLVDKLLFCYDEKSRTEITNDECKITIGDKKVWWWHRVYEKDASKLHLLRTRHPQGAPLGFTKKLVEWVRAR